MNDTNIPVLPSRAIEDSPDQARALAARIELAVAMGQQQVAEELYRRLLALPLSEAERGRMHAEFAVLDRLA
ncbi:hypothetical protein VW23_010755 [Devosia insulae DS-56]|uniref:Bacterial transcriptional activator domain-containing protein n=1 Tax=Devosia insulae DS-56 TaxID=1116389 RepID=A0A1E5XVI5_9HYPH|nr:hypothetical protein [Devosia insulae]OEO32608.1 hypothetical protein VW23_010755 [Devosia insulae DS-56]